MKYFPGFFLLLILLFSCARKENKNVLPENKMKEVMWDLIRADQYVADYLMRDSTRNKKDESMKLYEEIFHLHKVTRDQFKRSLAYYSSQPDLLRPIIDSLAKRKSEFMFPPTGVHPFPPDSANKPRLHRQIPKR
jgi:hypothetical protein